MNWKELSNQSEDFLNEPSNINQFSLKGHPEYPHLSDLPEEELIEMLSEFVIAEGHQVTITNMLNYAPIFEMLLFKKNNPSIYG
ncbi:MAG: hypothetical protein O9264_12225 [Leptospira sp.]|nr:hypothetical protein [Leptospira sp.]